MKDLKGLSLLLCDMMSKEKVRECPRCWVEMKKVKVRVIGRDVTIDNCPRCDGVFLDDGELKKITRNRSLHIFLTKYLGIDSDSKLLCPHCKGLMDTEDAGGVEVDVCIKCHGVWLDAGELESLKEKGEEEFEEIPDYKIAELFDEKVAKAREKERNSFLRKMFGGIARR